MKNLYAFLLLMVCSCLASSCGVATDMIKDNELRLGFLTRSSFESPVKLKVAVAPFNDEFNLGNIDIVGDNTAKLLEEELRKDSNLLVVPYTEVKYLMSSKGYKQPLEPEQAAILGRELGLNAIIIGSINEVKSYNMRKGWRRLIRFASSQQSYVDAVLSVSVIDSASGIILSSRANIGEYKVGTSEKDIFQVTKNDKNMIAPSQSALEASMDKAVEEAFYRAESGLASLPFKARVTSVIGDEAQINFGSNVGIKVGQKFVMFSVDKIITNAIGQQYEIPGAPIAKLKVTSVHENSSLLIMDEGSVNIGDYIQIYK